MISSILLSLPSSTSNKSTVIFARLEEAPTANPEEAPTELLIETTSPFPIFCNKTSSNCLTTLSVEEMEEPMGVAISIAK